MNTDIGLSLATDHLHDWLCSWSFNYGSDEHLAPVDLDHINFLSRSNITLIYLVWIQDSSIQHDAARLADVCMQGLLLLICRWMVITATRDIWTCHQGSADVNTYLSVTYFWLKNLISDQVRSDIIYLPYAHASSTSSAQTLRATCRVLCQPMILGFFIPPRVHYELADHTMYTQIGHFCTSELR